MENVNWEMKTSSDNMMSAFVAAVIAVVLIYFMANRIWWIAVLCGLGASLTVFSTTIYKVACSTEGFTYSRFFFKLAAVSWNSINEVVFHPGVKGGTYITAYMQVKRKDLKDVNIPADNFSDEDLVEFSKLLEKKAHRARVDSYFKNLKIKK